MTKKITTPYRPPIRPPIAISNPVINPSNSVVLRKLMASSLLSLPPLYKFQQSAGNFASLDRIDRLAPKNVDPPRAHRTPSRRISRPENHHSRRADRSRKMRHARIIGDESRRDTRDSSNR